MADPVHRDLEVLVRMAVGSRRNRDPLGGQEVVRRVPVVEDLA